MGVGSFLRLTRAGFILAREGAFSLVEPDHLPPLPRTAIRLGRRIQRRRVARSDQAERLTAALNKLGPSWVKLGQFLATRPDLVGPEIADGLGRLRDEIPPFPLEEAKEVVRRCLGKPVEALYASFSAPLAAASIAQVHRAEVVGPDGVTRRMAVKVMRPGIRRRLDRDLATFFSGARFIERVDRNARRLKPVAVVDRLARSVMLEMDLRLEAAALSEVAENARNDAGFRVPKVDWQRSDRDVLTLEWIDGIKMSEVAALEAAGHDLKALARRLMQIFLRHALRDGFFHADLHQGNLFVDPAGNIVAVDFGIMGRLSRAERRFLAEILYGFVKRDYRRIAEVHREAGYVPARHSIDDFAQALRAIGEPIHGQSARDISMARVLTQLLEVTEMFDMETRTELLLLQKTMMVVEGVARSLDPDFDMWATSEPILTEWVARHMGPLGLVDEALAGAQWLRRLVAVLPELGERAGDITRGIAETSRRGFRLDPDTVAQIAAATARRTRSERFAILIGVAALVGIFVALVT
ncbi:MAG: 2-polyprenylphenol 6-hydroxylase [Bauldia sp.]|nr:2-polyprenylphenol 6-hydroxylase [Bauldia sp.]MCW5716779.1 2-polyprenylphenol 6-hydroxylase [Bauldia sp.]